jgi:hypothetical protein
MSKTATLASGQISPTNKLLVELREPEELPASILITWPQAPSVIDPRRFGSTAHDGWWRQRRLRGTACVRTCYSACACAPDGDHPNMAGHEQSGRVAGSM